MTMRRLVLASAGVVLLVGCSHHPALKDAPVKSISDGGATVVNMPDQFPNVAWKCAGVNGVYVNTRTAGVNMVIITNDPNCQTPG
jgi:hypothetical protein